MSNDRLYIGLTVGIPAAVLVGVLVYTQIINPIKTSTLSSTLSSAIFSIVPSTTISSITVSAVQPTIITEQTSLPIIPLSDRLLDNDEMLRACCKEKPIALFATKNDLDKYLKSNSQPYNTPVSAYVHNGRLLYTFSELTNIQTLEQINHAYFEIDKKLLEFDTNITGQRIVLVKSSRQPYQNTTNYLIMFKDPITDNPNNKGLRNVTFTDKGWKYNYQHLNQHPIYFDSIETIYLYDYTNRMINKIVDDSCNQATQPQLQRTYNTLGAHRKTRRSTSRRSKHPKRKQTHKKR